MTIDDMTIFVAIVSAIVHLHVTIVGVPYLRVTVVGATIIAAIIDAIISRSLIEAMIATVAGSLHSRASEISRSSCRSNRRMPVIRRGEKLPVVAGLTFVVHLLV